MPGEDELKVRALLVDGVLKGWSTGDAHDVADRSLVVRRVIRLNDALPSDKAEGNEKLQDYDPGVSQISRFRDYGAYCGVTASGRSLFAVVAQMAAQSCAG